MSLKLGIVIVHYNTLQDLARCLESLRAEAPACPHEIVVVDNASTTTGLSELHERFGEVRWLCNTENVGYARGCNQGMAALSADFHLIINPDIVVLPGSLSALLAFAEAHPRAGLIGPQLLNEDGAVQESCRRFYTFKTLLLRRTILGKLFSRSETVQRHLMRDFDHASVRPVDWVLGGCMLVRREARNRCGPMDERFFLYFEDVDWCYRMWQSGFEVVYFPEARFIHRHRRASAQGRFSRSFWLHLGSLISFYEKWSLLVYAAKKWRRPVAVALHWLLDMVLLAVALLGAYGLRLALQPLFAEELLPLAWYRVWLAYAAVLVTVTFVLTGHYRDGGRREGPALAAQLKQIGLVGLLLLAGSYLGREEVVSRAVLLMMLGLYMGLSIWATAVIDRLNRRLEAGFFALERTLLAGPVAALENWLAESRDLHRDGIDLVGYVTDDRAIDAGHPAIGAGAVPWLGTLAGLPHLVERFRASQVVFWNAPDQGPEMDAVLVRLRCLRIRLRWILDEAWLLATGARWATFGAASCGVLDPDDSVGIRRLILRLLEMLFAVPMLAVTALFALPRRIMLRNSRIRRERVDVREDLRDHGGVEILVDRDGKPMPLWWQAAILRALLAGRIGIWGRGLFSGRCPVHTGRGDRAGSLPAWLHAVETRRPALTGPWSGEGQAAIVRILRAIKTVFLYPGGWAPEHRTDEYSIRRDDSREVDPS